MCVTYIELIEIRNYFLSNPWIINMAMRRYVPDTNFGYVSDLGLGDITLGQGHNTWMTHPWIMDNSSVKYYPDPTWQ